MVVVMFCCHVRDDVFHFFLVAFVFFSTWFSNIFQFFHMVLFIFLPLGSWSFHHFESQRRPRAALGCAHFGPSGRLHGEKGCVCK